MTAQVIRPSIHFYVRLLTTKLLLETLSQKVKNVNYFHVYCPIRAYILTWKSTKMIMKMLSLIKKG